MAAAPQSTGAYMAQEGGRWAKSLLRTPQLVYSNAFKVAKFEDHMAEEEHSAEMKRTLTPLDLVMLGVGIILGAGVFVVTASVAKNNAGPATIISYFIAGLSAMLSSFCYAEYAVDYPVAGGAFFYILMTFGEYIGWVVVANLMLEYVLANAAVARSFAGYFANLIGKESSFFIIPYMGYDLDFWAFALVLFHMVLLCLGTSESALFNLVVTVLHIAVVAFIIVAGLIKANPQNLIPFAPFGARGIFNGATVVFFSYIGFDAVACTAEECKDPNRALPIGIVGSLLIVTVFYILAALTLNLMVPLQFINATAGFSAAFGFVGWNWAKYIVALGALLGIVTGVLVGEMAVARILTMVGREHLMPGFFAYINPRLGTPLIATITLGVLTALIALVTAFDDLANLVAICTLFVFWIVALGILTRRYCVRNSGDSRIKGIPNFTASVVHLVWIFLSSLGMILWFRYDEAETSWWKGCGCFLLSWLVAVISMSLICKQSYLPKGFKTPLMPFLPGASILLNTFLLGTLEAKDYIKFAWFLLIITIIYLVYSIHAVQRAKLRAAERQDLGATEVGSIEMK